MKKLLVLGSDYFTLSVVKEAHTMGLYVIVTDLMDTSPAKEAADEAWMCSTTDIDLLEKKCIENGVNAVMYGASDFNVGNARILCDRLGLPIYCAEELPWKASRDKGLFKEVCKKNGVPVAQDYDLSPEPTAEELKRVKYPVVVKPVDKSGNRGISFCYTEGELVEGYRYARSISDNEHIIVERKLTGTTHNINYVVGNGEIRLASYTESDHDAAQPSYVYSFSRTTNHFLKQYMDEVNDSVIRAFKDLGCKEGIVWVDAIRDEDDGKFYILEMGYRFPAAVASCPLYEKVTGFNPVRWMIECALGVEHNAENMPAPLNGPYQSIVAMDYMFAKKAAKIARVEGLDEVNAMPNVCLDMPKRAGGETRELASIALISIYAENCQVLVDTLQKINTTFKVIDENGENVLIYFSDYEKILRSAAWGIDDFNA